MLLQEGGSVKQQQLRHTRKAKGLCEPSAVCHTQATSHCFGTTMPSTCRRATETTQLPKHMHVKHFIAYCARNIIIRTTRASQGKQKKRWYGLCLWETSTVNGVLRIVHVTGTYVKRCPTVQEALFNPFLILEWLWSNRWKTLRTQFLERFRT